ncbi:FHF complex subunit HOOK interacting protein 2A-like isoform X2 [Arctopsyche grandis]|uniref:FHF complex subunit HOOK interacting protein 2A-like isoform X2 n=1 Tax=Arctopsyche grandis TaxID=121162 RepID=UPI00406D7D2C
MLGRVSEALHNAADLIAPPATRLVDFQFHWKLIQNFYVSENVSTKVHVENTKIPLHLHQMLQFLVEEEAECGDILGPCINDLMDSKLGIASCLTSLAEADQPPGLRGIVLVWYNSLLRRVKHAPIHEVAFYRPIQKLLILCNNNPASPTEKEEVELLLTLCGLVRKQPDLVKLFLSKNYEEDICPFIVKGSLMEKPERNTLFEYDDLPKPFRLISLVSQPEARKSDQKECVENESISSTFDDEEQKNNSGSYEDDRFLLIDLLLSYLASADNHIVLRACEGIMIVTSLPDDTIAHLIANTSSVCAYLVDKLIDKYKALPENTDPCDLDQLNITWGYASQEFADKCVKSIGLRESTSFLSWLDYCDTLAKECHALLAIHLARTLRWHFFVAELELGLENGQNATLVTTVIGKCLKAIDSVEILNEISKWLVGDCNNVTMRPLTPILQTLIENCLEGEIDLCLETLRLFEVMLEKVSEHILHCLVLGFLEGRGYHAPIRASNNFEDEERERLNAQTLRQERESNRQTMKRVCEGHIDSNFAIPCEGSHSNNQITVDNNIHKVINSFLLLLPRNLLSDPAGLGYEQYMQDANRHYLRWLEATSGFNWPTRATWHDPSTSSTHSCDSRPEADLHMHSSPSSDHQKHPTADIKYTMPLNKNVEQISLLHSNSCYKCNKLENNCTDFKRHNSPSADDANKPDNLDDISDRKVEIDCKNSLESHSFHQPLVLNQRDRSSLSEMAEDEELTFDEGPFLKMLFKLLLNMPSQPYQINLQLTAIFSKLAMMPHPYLHEYLLNPVLPTGKNVTTLFKTLQKLSKIFMAQIPKVKKFSTIIEETRQRLLGDESIEDGDKSDPLFESLIVVEEFCKELAAIYFVKYHHSSQLHS